MALRALEVVLSIWDPNTTKTDFGTVSLKLCAVSDSPFTIEQLRNSHAVKVTFFRGNIIDYETAEEPWEEYNHHIAAVLDDICKWLSDRSREMHALMSEHELKMRIVFSAWIDDDQFELTLPPRLSTVCGECQIPIMIITNE